MGGCDWVVEEETVSGIVSVIVVLGRMRDAEVAQSKTFRRYRASSGGLPRE